MKCTADEKGTPKNMCFLRCVADETVSQAGTVAVFKWNVLCNQQTIDMKIECCTRPAWN
jgi:hypothetical protein